MRNVQYYAYCATDIMGARAVQASVTIRGPTSDADEDVGAVRSVPVHM